ncbi:MAG: phosphoadenosine phosphosulfate reductase family protein, partial [Pseudonocardiaceae bacterium]
MICAAKPKGRGAVIVPAQVQSLIEQGALFVVNHSGGKDSQAMLIVLRGLVPEEQLVVVHAELPGVEWEGTQEHIRATIGNLPLIVAKARRTFMEMVEARGRFPSPMQRQCTSDLKRGPIQREVRRHLKARPWFKG